MAKTHKRKSQQLRNSGSLKAGDKIIVLLASIAALGIVWMLFFRQDEGAGIRDSEPLGTLSTPGTIRRRHARSLNWSNVSGEVPLYLHDIVYVPKDTYGEVVFGENKRLRLEPDSMVQFDEVTVDSIFITLFDGKVQGDSVVTKKAAPPPAVAEATQKYVPKTVVPLPTMPPELELLSLKHESLMQRMSESRARVAKTRLEILKAMSRREVPMDNIAEYSIELLFPKKAVYNLKANRWLKMAWSDVPLDNVVYTLEMSRDKKFRQALTHKTVQRNLSVQVDIPGQYYWRVRAERNKVAIASAVGEFTMAKVGGLGTARELRQIASGRPEGYVAEISADENFQKVLSSNVVPGMKCVATNLSPGTYHCRIRALSSPKTIKTYAFEVQ